VVAGEGGVGHAAQRELGGTGPANARRDKTLPLPAPANQLSCLTPLGTGRNLATTTSKPHEESLTLYVCVCVCVCVCV
jgi:hypothetical protein